MLTEMPAVDDQLFTIVTTPAKVLSSSIVKPMASMCVYTKTTQVAVIVAVVIHNVRAVVPDNWPAVYVTSHDHPYHMLGADSPLQALPLLTHFTNGGGEGLFEKLIKPLTCEAWKRFQQFRMGCRTPN